MACYVNGLHLDLNMDWNDIFSRLKKPQVKIKEGNLSKNLKSKSWIALKCWSTKADWLQTSSPKKKTLSNRNSPRVIWPEKTQFDYYSVESQITNSLLHHLSALSQLVSFSPTEGKWAFCLSITGGLTDLNSSWSLSCDLYVCQCVSLSRGGTHTDRTATFF